MPRAFSKKRSKRGDGISRAQDDAPTEPPLKKMKPSLPEPILQTETVPVESEWPLLEPDNKAYWIQINEKIIQLEQIGVEADGDDTEEDERRLLLRTALTNLSNQELALATDPEASVILERLLHTMDDFARRVLADRFAGLYLKLAQHQFASHVLETLFTLGAETADRETRGIIAAGPSTETTNGSLPTMTNLLVSASQEFTSLTSELLCHTYASHVIRALLCLLSGKTSPAAQSSKKSKHFKKAQAPMRNLFAAQQDKEKARALNTPPDFAQALDVLFQTIDHSLQSGIDARNVAADDVGTLVIQIALQIEADNKKSQNPNSILDRVLHSLISTIQETGSADRSDFLETMLRSPSTSHTFELILSPVVSSDQVFHEIWRAYFHDRVQKLATHPVSNFVFAKAVQRLDAETLSAVIDTFEGEKIGRNLLETARTGPLQSIIDRCCLITEVCPKVVELLKSTFSIEHPSSLAVPAILQLVIVPRVSKTAPIRIHAQGSFMLQSWLKLPSSHYSIVTESLFKCSPTTLLEIAKTQSGSPIFETLLAAPNISAKDKRAMLLRLIGHYHSLADDKFGSRVADSCWLAADVYLKDKIAVSLADKQEFLLASRYGSFFLKKLMLPLHQRKNEEWRAKMASPPRSRSLHSVHK